MLLGADQQTTIPMLSEELNVHTLTIPRQLKEIGKFKKHGKWVQRKLIENWKNYRCEVSSTPLLQVKYESFLELNVTCDVKWIFYGNGQRGLTTRLHDTLSSRNYTNGGVW